MKFGKHIQDQAHPEWAHHYMNYKMLKKMIPDFQASGANNGVLTVALVNHENNDQSDFNPNLNSTPGAVFTEPADTENQASKTAFFFRLDRELEKVNTFYLKKEAELKVRIRTLVDKRKVIELKDNAHNQSSVWRALSQAFAQFQQDLNKLQQFVEINGTGFRKILKKWDKRNRSTTKDQYLSRQVKVQKCFDQVVIAELSDICSTNISELEAFLTDNISSPVNNDSKVTNSAALDIEAELFRAVSAGQASIVQEILVQRKLLTSENSIDGRDYISPVFWRACSEAAPANCIEILVNTNKINYNFNDDISQRTCLHEAAIHGNSDLLKLCVEKGSRLDCADIYGRTPLHYLAMYGHEPGLKYLIDYEANLSLSDHEGLTALLYAISNGFTECVKVLLATQGEMGSDSQRALFLASQYGHKDIVELLLQKKPSTNGQEHENTDNLMPLHVACRQGHDQVCQLLCDSGANLNVIDHDKGWTPLFYSASEGHEACLRILLKAGCKLNILDELNLSPVYYAAYEGHASCVKLLLEAGCTVDIPHPTNNMEFIGKDDNVIDDIPSLLLPPPLLPFRIYGHNYLDKKYLVQLQLGHHTEKGLICPPIKLYANSHMSSLKLILTPRNSLEGQFNAQESQSVILPLADANEVYNFEVDNLTTFGLEFAIYPTFGSKVIGKAVALPTNFNNYTFNHHACPLFDSHLKVVGDISFTFTVIKPYTSVNLEVGGRIETYWKSPNEIVGTSPLPLLSNTTNLTPMVTVSSLAHTYLMLAVQLSKDLKPIVYRDSKVKLGGVEISPYLLTFDQFKSLGKSRATATDKDRLKRGNAPLEDLHILTHQTYLSLEEALDFVPKGLGVCLEIVYLDDDKSINSNELPDVNIVADKILDVVYKVANSKPRSFVFHSFNTRICNTLNWKQPNYAVFVSTYAGFNTNQTGSIKSAVQFAKRNNLLGIMVNAQPLLQVPSLIKKVKEFGFLLASFGDSNKNEDLVNQQNLNGVDITVSRGILNYNTSSTTLTL